MSSGTRFRRNWLLPAFAALVALVAFGAGGCKGHKRGESAAKKTSGAGSSARSSASEEPEMRDGLSSEWRLDHPECKHAKRVTSPDPGSPEETILKAYRAALEPDGDEAFQRFYATLDSDEYTENEARRQFWGRLREHITKYVEGPDDPSYIICRVDRKPGHDDYIKIFVFSKVRTKSNPPLALVRKGDDWRINFFNY